MKQVVYVLLLCILVSKNYVKGYIDDSYNLPTSIQPIRYHLTLEPNLNITHQISSTFNGSVTIELNVLENTKNITLHLRDLTVNEKSITIVDSNSNESSTVKVLDTEIDKERQFYIIHLDTILLANSKYNLIISDFYGDLHYDNIGFYLAKYYDTETNESKHLALSDFEPSDARKAFPCFDAPDMKAKFNIHLIRPNNYFSLANEGLIATEDLGNNRYKDSFGETVIMPTYVVAFIVCDFKGTAQLERHRVFAKGAAIDSGSLNYALSKGVEILQTIEKFTGVDYPLSKMDQIAIPNRYFQDEAMENWGLVTFSEQHLFISNETSKTEDIQRCVTYIAHEFSHQWFGNLVTFNQWKYIWLSEGFAAFFQYYITSLVQPSWRIMDQFVIDVFQKILTFDTRDTEPMNQEPKYIGKIPSPLICYLKASSVIRMSQHFLTPPIFQRGINIYLEKNKFKSVDPLILYEAYQEAIDETNSHELLGNNSVASILQAWDSNAGFPILTVTRNYETGSVTINQTRYFDTKLYEHSNTWPVPINFVLQSDNNFNFEDTSAQLWLTNKSITIDQNENVKGWLLLNKQVTGYYRVNYDKTNWDRLAAYLNSEEYIKIHPANRAQLLHTAFYLAKQNYIPYSIPLNISKYLIRETDYIPISPFIDALEDVKNSLISSKYYDVLTIYVTNLLSTAYNRLGFDETPNETNLDKLNRIKILNTMCSFGHSDSINKAVIKLQEWKESGKVGVPPNLEFETLCCAMKNAPIEDWELMSNKLKTSSKTEKKLYSSALDCSENPVVVNRLLDTILKPNKTLDYFTRTDLYRITSTVAGRNAAIKYIQNSSGDLSLEFIYIICTQVSNMEYLNQMNIRDKVSTAFYDRIVRLVTDNAKSYSYEKQIQIEEWLSDYNFV